MQGSSPGDAATLPQLLHAAAAQTRARDGVTKLQLGVGNAGSGQEVNVASRKACAAPRCPRLTHTHPRGVGALAINGRSRFRSTPRRDATSTRAAWLAGRRRGCVAETSSPRCGRDVVEMWSRCGRDVAEMWSR